MISSLRGTITSRSPTEVVVDVGGVGYALSIPLSTAEKIGRVGDQVSLLTHLVVRQDALQLYGFGSAEERDAFRILLSVNGIGPRMAQGILSGISVTELRAAIVKGDTTSLTAVPGIGKKLADRLVLELRDRIGKLDVSTQTVPPGSPDEAHLRSEAALALISLGYSRTTAERAVRAALLGNPSSSLEALVKGAIRNAQR